MTDEVKKEHIKGRYGIIQTLITAVATIVAAVIGLYAVTLQNANTSLLEQNTKLQEQNDVLMEESRINISAIENQVISLESQVSELNDKNRILQAANDTFKSDYEDALSEIGRLNEELQKLTESITNPDAESSTMAAQITSLLDVCPPYEHSFLETPPTFQMMGSSYTNGFVLALGGSALFNLDSKYTELNFDIGHIDGSGSHYGSYLVYLDGKYAQTIDVNSEMVVKPICVQLNNARQMKIVGENNYPVGSAYKKYGFANAVLK